MCAKCVELDKKIERIKRLIGQVMDQKTHDGAAELIARIEAEKLALHAAQKN